ncbi:phospholipid-transporting ATPase ABCA3-like isoform X2 [Scylla paramamosain]|uniref:phospholipid-transporting ATPase ABCA3-like isoform X2 n=1 Tax=Scylla paramamosain TaxID=85552 RepID=UPI003082769B
MVTSTSSSVRQGWLAQAKMGSSTSGLRKFWLLLWKNWILQRRRKIQTVLEVVVPLVFCVLLVVIRDLAPYGVFPNATHYNAFPITSLPDTLKPGQGEGMWDTITDSIIGDGISRRRRSLPLPERSHPHLRRKRQNFIESFFGFSLEPKWPIAYSPNTTAVTKLMNLVAERLVLAEKMYGFATEEDLVNYLSSLAKEQDKDAVVDILGGIVFTNPFPEDDILPHQLSYKIRLKGSQRAGQKRNPFLPPPQWYTELSYPLFQVPGPRSRTKNNGGRPGYFDEGFLAIQHAVDMSIAEFITGKDPGMTYTVEMQRMPYPPFIDDTYLVALQAWLPFVLLVSYIYPAINIVKSVVYEKEKKLKESMKIMGLKNYLHWSAWFIKSFMFLASSTSLITVLLCVHWHGPGSLAVLSQSDPSLVLVFLLLYTVTAICFCFFLSTLFSKANSAAAITGLIWFFTYVPYTVLRPRYASLTLGNKLALCLLCNTAMSLGCQLTSMFEGTGSGIQWNLLFSGVSPDDPFTLAHVFGMLVLDSLLFSILAWYIEALWPGDFGVPQPWYFPFMKSYWLGRSVDEVKEPVTPPIQNSMFFENDPKGILAGVQVKGLTKVFSRLNKVAVNKLNLNMYNGQITVLLGHNGAGKTTTMSMLTGLFPPTSGTALVGGHDIVTEMDEVRLSLGLCPQHDILFDDLTVSEHIIFFSKLKGMSGEAAEEEVRIMVKKLKLEDKKDALARTLSGGMKRKLSVGIALCGGSRVVFMDEPTSGMDPGARRLIWDLLQQERTGRTILLTTHFMEEADLLGDRIAIMANGVVQCCGTSLFLKKMYGAGYRLIIVKEKGCDVGAITQRLQAYIPDAELDQNVGAELSYVLPTAEVSKFEAMFLELEQKKAELKISSYGASQTTMDEVFLRVGEASEPDLVTQHRTTLLKAKAVANGVAGGGVRSAPHENGHLLEHADTIEEIPIDTSPGDQGRLMATWFNAATQRVTLALQNAKNAASNVLESPSPRRMPLLKNSGCLLLLQQFWAMLVKKVLYTFRNKFLTFAQNVIPVAFLILALVVVQTLPGVNDAPPEVHFSLNNFDGTVTTLQVMDPNNQTKELLGGLTGVFKGRNVLESVPPDANHTTEILEEAARDLPSFNQHNMVSLSINGGQDRASILAFFNNQPFHTPPLALALADIAVVRAFTNNNNITITTSNHPLPRTDIEKLTQDQRQNLGFQIGFNLAFGMSFLAASFVIFLIQERSSKAKHLQFVSGVNFVTYWLASAIWDYLLFIIPCCLCLLCLALFGMKGLSEGEQLGRIFLVMLMYCWASLPLMYLCSFFFSIPSGGFTKMIMVNIITGMATIITVTILRIPDLELQDVAQLLDWIFLLFPSYAMAAAITDIYSNFRSTEICKQPAFTLICSLNIAPNPCCREESRCGSFGCVEWTEDYLGWEKLGVGRMLVFLALEGVAFFLLITIVEMKVFQRVKYTLARLRRAITPWKSGRELEDGLDTEEDEDVVAERLRILNTPPDKLMDSDRLILRDLCKTYPGGLTAVDHINLGVPLGECFGLLGINGAGKTTTFKMLTGDLQVSEGDAYVNRYSIKADIKKVRQDIGYCPQFDALLDHLTGRETLRMFARLRGVPERLIDSTIKSLAEELLITQHLDNLFKNYSGGNKRKLSTGVALVGDPPLVLLDEPSSGMDPVARRLLWDALTSVRDAGRSIILTSHSMEECEALCTRLAIMVNGKFRCLGSPQHLKSKFSEGYSIILRVKMSEPEDGEGNYTIDQASPSRLPPEMRSVQTFIKETYPKSHLREMQWGRLEYFVPAEGLTWASVFGTLERSRQHLPIEDYSVTQTTLERVFLTFTRGQRPDEQDKR